ncbi:MAG: Calx-beta domain-containing protein [Cyclobacteriaceae bacterium]
MSFNKLFVSVFSLTLLLSCSKSDSVTPVATPVLNIQGVTQTRSTADGTMRFYFNLSKKISKDVSVDYSMIDGTAVSPDDYVKASGTLTVPANTSSAYIDVQIKGDPTDLRQPNLTFTVQLSNPVDCALGSTSAIGTLVTENGSYLPTDNTGYSTPSSYSDYTLVWSDEFSESALDLGVWGPETGNGSGGWGNNELEYYTNSTKNVFLSNGNLIIEARKRVDWRIQLFFSKD